MQTEVDPIPVAAREGLCFWTPEGKRYLDFNSQLMCTNIGHSHPKVVKAIQEQAATLAYANPFMATEPRARLGAKLAEITPGDIDTFFFTNGGAEANENAIKIARLFTGRQKILAATARITAARPARSRSPAIRAAGRRSRASRASSTSPTSTSGAGGTPSPWPRVLSDIEDVVRYEGATTIAAIIVETIVGTNGILIPPDGYMQGLRKICDRTASCSSWTRSWRASGAPAAGSRSTTGASCPTSSPWPRA